MIPRNAQLTVERIPLGHLVIGEDLERDHVRILKYANLLEDKPDHDMEPAIVESVGKNLYRIRNGHHRFLAAIICGRPDLLAVVISKRTKSPA